MQLETKDRVVEIPSMAVFFYRCHYALSLIGLIPLLQLNHRWDEVWKKPWTVKRASHLWEGSSYLIFASLRKKYHTLLQFELQSIQSPCNTKRCLCAFCLSTKQDAHYSLIVDIIRFCWWNKSRTKLVELGSLSEKITISPGSTKPIESMYGIFTYMYHTNQPYHVGKYKIYRTWHSIGTKLLGCPRKLGSMLSKWGCNPTKNPIYKCRWNNPFRS